MGSGSSATQHQLNQLTSEEAAAIAAGLTQEERQRIWTAVASLEVQREDPSKPSFRALRSYFLKDYKGGGVFQNEEYDHHADDWCWIHKGSGIKVWADALDLTQSCCIGDVECVFHYTTEKGFRNITDPSKQAVELFASLITEGEKANAWWGKGVYSVRKAPDEWPDVATLIDNNYRNMHKRDIELKGREAADQEYRSRVAYCIPILANVAMTYDVSVQQTPEMVEKGKPAGVNLAGKLLNEPGQPERQCIVIRVEREEEVGNASAVLVDTLRCRAEAAAKRVGQPATEAIVATGRLAQVVAERGGLSEALGLRRRELAAWEAAVGAEDPRTLMAMHNLAFVLDCLGNYPEAEGLLRRALEGREKHLGPEHLDTLNSVLNLGDLLMHKRQFEEAEPLYRRALEGTEAQLGPMHPHTLISVNNLAVLLKKQNKLDEAEKLHRRALEGTEAQLGPMHPDTLVYVNNLAVLLQNQNKLDEAERFFRRALEGTEAQLGATHPSTLQSVTNLAALLKEQNKLDEAEELHRAALASKESQLGPMHRSTIASFFYLADLLEAKGAFIEAEKLYLSELRGLEALHGPDAKVTRGRRRALHRFQQQHGLAGGQTGQ